MSTAYIRGINGHSLGDIVGCAWYDIQAARHGVELYWNVHHGIDRGGALNHSLSDGWFHVELFRLLDRAGLFVHRVHIPAINDQTVFLPDRLSAAEKYVELVYGRRLKLADYGQHPDFDTLFRPPVRYMPGEFRHRFRFLGCPSESYAFPAGPSVPSWHYRANEVYATCQPTSTSLVDDALVAQGRGKRITLGRAIDHLRTLPARGIKRLYILGGRRDMPINASFVERLRPRLPGIEVIDATGQTTIEQYFGRLYGSAWHLSGESNSAFFTAQLGIESVQVYRPVSVHALENFASYFRDVPSLKLEFDSADCLEGDISDLAA